MWENTWRLSLIFFFLYAARIRIHSLGTVVLLVCIMHLAMRNLPAQCSLFHAVDSHTNKEICNSLFMFSKKITTTGFVKASTTSRMMSAPLGSTDVEINVVSTEPGQHHVSRFVPSGLSCFSLERWTKHRLKKHCFQSLLYSSHRPIYFGQGSMPALVSAQVGACCHSLSLVCTPHNE